MKHETIFVEINFSDILEIDSFICCFSKENTIKIGSYVFPYKGRFTEDVYFPLDTAFFLKEAQKNKKLLFPLKIIRMDKTFFFINKNNDVLTITESTIITPPSEYKEKETLPLCFPSLGSKVFSFTVPVNFLNNIFLNSSSNSRLKITVDLDMRTAKIKKENSKDSPVLYCEF